MVPGLGQDSAEGIDSSLGAVAAADVTAPATGICHIVHFMLGCWDPLSKNRSSLVKKFTWVGRLSGRSVHIDLVTFLLTTPSILFSCTFCVVLCFSPGFKNSCYLGLLFKSQKGVSTNCSNS
jgi:hypothetical protein